MKILAVMALAALVGCSRNDKTATEEPASTVTVTSAPIAVGGSGSAPDPATKAAAELAVANASGVVGALEEITLQQPGAESPDDRTAFKIQLALLQDQYFVDHAGDVDVKVDHGVASLHGTTSTPEARTAAERITSKQPGVTVVDNQLRLGPVDPTSGHTRR